MKKLLLTLSLLLASFAGAFAASTSLELPFTGDLSNSGISVSSNVYMKFVLGDTGGTTAYWSNDGSVAGAVSEPTASQMVSVEDGIFSIWLGDTDLTGMAALSSTVFDSGDVYLRVWVSDDNSTFYQQTPDIRMDSAAFAFKATMAADTDKVGGVTPGATGLALLDDANATTARATLGLGTAATSANTDFAASSHGHLMADISDIGTAAGNASGDFASATHAHDASAITSGTLASTTLPDMVGDTGAGGTKGAVPAPTAGDNVAGKFLKADGTWAVPNGAGDMSASTYDANMDGWVDTANNSISLQNVTPGAAGLLVMGNVTTANIISTLGLGTSSGNASSDFASTAHGHSVGEITGLGTMATQNTSAVAVTGGSIDGTAIGGTTPSTGAFTSLDSSSLAVTGSTNLGGLLMPTSDGTVGQVITTDGSGNLVFTNASAGGGSGANLANNETILGDWNNTTNPWADNEVADALTINGGTIENTPIGATTSSTGNFTTLTTSSTANLGGLLFPIVDGTNGQVLTTNGSGNLSWAAQNSITNDSISSANIQDGSIFTADLATGSVTTAEISDGTVSTADLADSVITTAKLGAVVLSSANMSNDLISGANIVDGSLSASDLASGVTNGYVLQTDGSGALSWVVQSGGSSVFTSGSGNSVASDNLGVGVNSPTATLDLSASTSDSASLRIRQGTAPSSPNLGDVVTTDGNLQFYNGSGWVNFTSIGSTITNADISNSANITLTKIDGLGSMATQAASNVNITGGSADFSSVSITDSLKLSPLASPPSNPAHGEMFYSVDGSLYIFSSGIWNSVQLIPTDLVSDNVFTKFDNSFYYTTSDSNLLMTGDQTWVCEFKYDDIGDTHVGFLSTNEGVSEGGISLRKKNATADIQLVIGHNSGSPAWSITDGGTVTGGQWHEIVMISNSDNYKVYLDGAQVIDVTQSGMFITSGSGFEIGRANGTPAGSDNVSVRNVKIYSGAPASPVSSTFDSDGNLTLKLNSPKADGGNINGVRFDLMP